MSIYYTIRDIDVYSTIERSNGKKSAYHGTLRVQGEFSSIDNAVVEVHSDTKRGDVPLFRMKNLLKLCKNLQETYRIMQEHKEEYEEGELRIKDVVVKDEGDTD